MSIADLRENYDKYSLDESEISRNPFEQFSKWFEDAKNEGGLEPNAMTVSTVSAQGEPSARVCLLKGFSEQGFVFFTNYLSRKGHELSRNPYCCLLFFWMHQQRQVRINGMVEQISETESTEYFESRPHGSKIGAWASEQSQVVAKEILQSRFAQYAEKYPESVPKPPHWGGYIVIPHQIEFWQGRPSRLHDRITFIREQDGSWIMHRLAP
ncbi:pyridoxamine 5'-phosphate oxidase [Taylorella asinigenitalis 14/45]|uniref:Pyridoxine/pyridoxamine 5'-phosphate oxidase n=1 Tax=Taylorella asinigenitalis 14/45 TaxID=1091495 RepID=I7JMY0_9BURK|nr:pyridoxamine 5'-phosphate oxidase [Taylorella asinigenitalis]CCG19855.1 pyridoxamine 5'-phosphate oxidase [Taylorella asinigenitalis 14/45]